MRFLFIILCLITNCSLASECIKEFDSSILLPKKNGTITVPPGLHESHMKISCDMKNLGYIPYEPAVFQVGDEKIVMYEEITKNFIIKHRHIYGEAQSLSITTKNFDGFSRILFYNCKSSCY